MAALVCRVDRAGHGLPTEQIRRRCAAPQADLRQKSWPASNLRSRGERQLFYVPEAISLRRSPSGRPPLPSCTSAFADALHAGRLNAALCWQYEKRLVSHAGAADRCGQAHAVRSSEQSSDSNGVQREPAEIESTARALIQEDPETKRAIDRITAAQQRVFELQVVDSGDHRSFVGNRRLRYGTHRLVCSALSTGGTG